MKWKWSIGGFRFKLKLGWGGQHGYKLPPVPPVDPEARLEEKLYRLFSKKYCSYHPGHIYYGNMGSCLVYYKGCDELKCKEYLIGELMAGETKINFFKRKGIEISEDIKRYKIKQKDRTLAKFDKEWVEAQGQYQ